MWVASDDARVYAIAVFDDGNDRYESLPNEWRVTMTWKGKSALVNVADARVCVASISTWKLRPL